MKCQKCGNHEANVHYTESINGSVREIALCTECAKETGLLGRTNGMFADMEREMLALTLPFGSSLGRRMFRSLFTPTIPETGFLGVETAGEMPGLKNDPAPAPESENETENDLKARLLDAIADERYEDAAKLRDKLKKLKGE